MLQAVAVAASETQVGGAYMAAVTEAAPALPEIADTEEESELAEEPAIAPPGKPPLQNMFVPRMCHCVCL